MGDSDKDISNVRRSVPIKMYKERKESNICESNTGLPKGFIPIRVNMIKSPGDYQKCIKCEERITISSSIITCNQIKKTKTKITNHIKPDSRNTPVQKKESYNL